MRRIERLEKNTQRRKHDEELPIADFQLPIDGE